MKLATAVRKALDEVKSTAADKGTAELAMTYARAIDDGDDLTKLGPLLLNVLESMLMTPRARATVLKGMKNEHVTKSPLDELRARRESRVNRAKAMDPTTS